MKTELELLTLETPRRCLAARAAAGSCRGLWWIVSKTALVVLTALHGPIDFVLRVLSFAGLAATVMSLVMDPVPARQQVMIAGVVTALVATALRMAYRSAVSDRGRGSA